MVKRVLERLFSRALQLCSKKYLAQEEQFLKNAFAESGHSVRKTI